MQSINLKLYSWLCSILFWCDSYLFFTMILLIIFLFYFWYTWGHALISIFRLYKQQKAITIFTQPDFIYIFFSLHFRHQKTGSHQLHPLLLMKTAKMSHTFLVHNQTHTLLFTHLVPMKPGKYKRVLLLPCPAWM